MMNIEDGYLDSLLSSSIEDALTPTNLTLRLVQARFEKSGVHLTASQIDQLRKALENGDLDKVSIDLDEEQEAQFRAVEGDDTTLKLDVPDMDKLTEQIQEAINTTAFEAIRLISESLLEDWKTRAESVLRDQREERTNTNVRVREAWGRALDLLDMLVGVCMEEGARFNDRFRKQEPEGHEYVCEVLTRLHARGCQVAFEILTLLGHGFADGAHARWRTLHELAVVALFINEHGQGVAERYLHHADATAYRAARRYQEHCSRLGYAPISSKEVDELKATRDSLVKKYGPDFDKDYGWAIGSVACKRPTFANIERSVKLDHLRPFYGLANLNVHADPRGAIHRIGIPLHNDSLLLAGQSVFGLADPGQNTAVSINQLTAALLLAKPNLDRLAFLQATQALVNEVFEAFMEAHETLGDGDAG